MFHNGICHLEFDLLEEIKENIPKRINNPNRSKTLHLEGQITPCGYNGKIWDFLSLFSTTFSSLIQSNSTSEHLGPIPTPPRTPCTRDFTLESNSANAYHTHDVLCLPLST